ncbi:hypothetical protein [Pseudarthrobacter sp. N5]|uniref:hypothetical protein n=1 Tax=Pseudarthrobacter sp. N5 TaxID=3418416 RepID=UPI003CF3F70D
MVPVNLRVIRPDRDTVHACNIGQLEIIPRQANVVIVCRNLEGGGLANSEPADGDKRCSVKGEAGLQIEDGTAPPLSQHGNRRRTGTAAVRDDNGLIGWNRRRSPDAGLMLPITVS